MGKATIIEAQNSETVFEQGSNKGILGKLKGVFADYKHGTRNSDRLYSEELWDNRVFGSEDVMEALETKTLFGELDHPEGDRCETLAKNAAFVCISLVVVAFFTLIAVAFERAVRSTSNDRERILSTRRIVFIGLFSAIAAILFCLDFPVFFAAPLIPTAVVYFCPLPL